MIRRPPRSTLDRSSAASDVYKRQAWNFAESIELGPLMRNDVTKMIVGPLGGLRISIENQAGVCLLYTSDAADERSSVDLGGRRIIKKKKKRYVKIGRRMTKQKDTKHEIKQSDMQDTAR